MSILEANPFSVVNGNHKEDRHFCAGSHERQTIQTHLFVELPWGVGLVWGCRAAAELQEVPKPPAAEGIHAAGGLIEDHQLGIS